MDEREFIPDAEKLRAIEREIALRRSAYPKWVAAGRIKQQTADREIAVMEAIAVDYRLRLNSAH